MRSVAYMSIALIDLNFLLRSAQNCKKKTFLDNLGTKTQERNMETRQMTLFFHPLFPLYVFATFSSELENIQNLFSCFHTLIFRQKLPILTAHHNSLESRHP